LTVPAACAGAVAFNSVADTNVTNDAAAVPNFTVAPGTNPLPIIVTAVPPAVDPERGLTDDTVGTALTTTVWVLVPVSPFESVTVNDT
jgi:hypothetical protein